MFIVGDEGAGVLVVADVVLDVRAGAVTALEPGGLAGLVGEDRLKAVSVVVGEGELRAGVCALAAHDHPRALGPARQVQCRGDLDHLAVGARGAVLLDRRIPVLIGDLEDLGPDRVAQFVAHRIADSGLAAPVEQVVACARAVGSQQEPDALDVLLRDLADRVFSDRDLVGGGIRASVPGP
jgi:hypothetical protein